jgi:small nuclear ribonucleoprotein E
MASRVQKMMVQPINLIFTFLQKKTRVEVWLYDNSKTRLEGRIIVSVLGTGNRT